MKTILSIAPAAAVLLAAGMASGQTYTYTTENGKTTITGFATGTEPTGAIVVPATLGGYTVTEIGRSAFKDRTGITSISFASGASVTKLGATAFQGCTALQSVALPTGITAIPSGLLQGCSGLATVTIGSAVSGIGDGAFADCRALASVSLPSGLTSLGESAFMNCRALASVTIPSGVTVIPGQLFQECRALSSLVIPAGVTAIGYSAFQDCAALTTFSSPASLVGIGHDAFRGCAGLTTFGINAALANIGSQAFDGCESLAALTVDPANAAYSSLNGVLFNKARSTLLRCPAGMTGSYTVPGTVTSVADAAFAHCDALSGVTIPAGVATIGTDAFYYATGLVTPVMAEGVANIGAWAFAGCKGMAEFTIPASVAVVGNDAFHHCSALVGAIYKGNAPTMGSSVFDSAATGFTIYYYSGKSGFTSPTWLGYAASIIGDIPAAISNWLAQNGIASGTALLSDSNNDGVSLLLAYALGLDPSLNLAGSMPVPVMGTNSMSLSFKGSSSGISYAVQSSVDMTTWSQGGVTLSEPDANGIRTATVAAGDGVPARFLRVVVRY